jgi:hypothetical protein
MASVNKKMNKNLEKCLQFPERPYIIALAVA